ncbi:MAG: PDZ domain-containing protein [Puniceicoccaceae bacterium]|nr:MAG: PDZ domain-containing protein [Puniceicoccaceae bacterium]
MMMLRRLCSGAGLAATFLLFATPLAANLEALFKERTRSVVGVEFFIQTELERRPVNVVGLVLDEQGHILLLDSAVPGWLPPDQLRDFRLFVPGMRDGKPAEYLGQSYVTGWHFLRAGEEVRGELAPFTRFGIGEVAIGEEIWGIGLMGRDFNYQPYFLNGRLALVQRLPQQIGFSASDLANPGSAVFNREGAFVGWAGNPLTQERVLFMDSDRYPVGFQNPNASSSFFLAEEVLPYLEKIPESPLGHEIPWLGLVGLQPVDPEVAEFLDIRGQAALVVSEVMEESPAGEAGFQVRDILLSLDGEPFPRFSPDRVLATFFERALLERQPGETITVDVLRGRERLAIEARLGRQPTLLKEARRQYFDRIGVTLREFVVYDGISRRLPRSEFGGVIANFVKPNSPASGSGLQAGDLIREIDGVPVDDYEQAIRKLDTLDRESGRSEIVLLVARGADTSVLRIQLR